MTADPATTLARLDTEIGELAARRIAVGQERANLWREMLEIDRRLEELMREQARLIEGGE